MNIGDVKSAYYDNSAKSSEIVRQLGLAGLALVWLFKMDHSDGTSEIPRLMVAAAILIGFALTFDLVQYVLGTAIWGIYNFYKKSRADENTVFEAPWAINYPALAAFILKIIFIVAAYAVIVVFLLRKFGRV